MPNKDRAIVNFMNKHPWAILPEALETIQEIVCNHMDGVKVELSRGDNYSGEPYLTDDGTVAIIPIHGTIAKKLYGLEAISGGNTTKEWTEAIKEALENEHVEGIVLDIDSPGGTVDGTKELADFIFNSRSQKPIIAYANGTMASAAYWVGSAAEKIVAFDTSQVGSIGVIVSHRDFSKREEAEGIKTTHIYAGKYKAMGSPYEPLSKESREYIQGRVDYYYTMFVDAVAQHRGTDSSTVINTMAEGRVFIGNQAKDVNLVDVIGNLQVAINLAKQGGSNVTLKETIEKHGASAVLAELVVNYSADLPSEVVNAYIVATTPKVEIPAEIQAQLSALQEKIDKLDKEKAEAEELLEAERAETAQRERRASIVGKLSAVKLGDDETLINTCMKLEDAELDHFVQKLEIYQRSAATIAEELFAPTEGATSEGGNADAPANFDEAVAFVMKRDKCDIEAAIKLAASEYPEHYQVFKSTPVKGGN